MNEAVALTLFLALKEINFFALYLLFAEVSLMPPVILSVLC